MLSNLHHSTQIINKFAKKFDKSKKYSKCEYLFSIGELLFFTIRENK